MSRRRYSPSGSLDDNARRKRRRIDGSKRRAVKSDAEQLDRMDLANIESDTTPSPDDSDSDNFNEALLKLARPNPNDDISDDDEVDNDNGDDKVDDDNGDNDNNDEDDDDEPLINAHYRPKPQTFAKMDSSQFDNTKVTHPSLNLHSMNGLASPSDSEAERPLSRRGTLQRKIPVHVDKSRAVAQLVASAQNTTRLGTKANPITIDADVISEDQSELVLKGESGVSELITPDRDMSSKAPSFSPMSAERSPTRTSVPPVIRSSSKLLPMLANTQQSTGETAANSPMSVSDESQPAPNSEQQKIGSGIRRTTENTLMRNIQDAPTYSLSDTAGEVGNSISKARSLRQGIARLEQANHTAANKINTIGHASSEIELEAAALDMSRFTKEDALAKAAKKQALISAGANAEYISNKTPRKLGNKVIAAAFSKLSQDRLSRNGGELRHVRKDRIGFPLKVDNDVPPELDPTESLPEAPNPPRQAAPAQQSELYRKIPTQAAKTTPLSPRPGSRAKPVQRSTSQTVNEVSREKAKSSPSNIELARGSASVHNRNSRRSPTPVNRHRYARTPSEPGSPSKSRPGPADLQKFRSQCVCWHWWVEECYLAERCHFAHFDTGKYTAMHIAKLEPFIPRVLQANRLERFEVGTPAAPTSTLQQVARGEFRQLGPDALSEHGYSREYTFEAAPRFAPQKLAGPGDEDHAVKSDMYNKARVQGSRKGGTAWDVGTDAAKRVVVTPPHTAVTKSPRPPAAPAPSLKISQTSTRSAPVSTPLPAPLQPQFSVIPPPGKTAWLAHRSSIAKDSRKSNLSRVGSVQSTNNIFASIFPCGIALTEIEVILSEYPSLASIRLNFMTKKERDFALQCCDNNFRGRRMTDLITSADFVKQYDGVFGDFTMYPTGFVSSHPESWTKHQTRAITFLHGEQDNRIETNICVMVFERVTLLFFAGTPDGFSAMGLQEMPPHADTYPLLFRMVPNDAVESRCHGIKTSSAVLTLSPADILGPGGPGAQDVVLLGEDARKTEVLVLTALFEGLARTVNCYCTTKQPECMQAPHTSIIVLCAHMSLHAFPDLRELIGSRDRDHIYTLNAAVKSDEDQIQRDKRLSSSYRFQHVFPVTGSEAIFITDDVIERWPVLAAQIMERLHSIFTSSEHRDRNGILLLRPNAGRWLAALISSASNADEKIEFERVRDAYWNLYDLNVESGEFPLGEASSQQYTGSANYENDNDDCPPATSAYTEDCVGFYGITWTNQNAMKYGKITLIHSIESKEWQDKYRHLDVITPEKWLGTR